MKMALREALKQAATLDEVPVGAVIVAQGRQVLRHNLCERLRDFTAHAEMQAFTCIPSTSATSLDQYLVRDAEPCPHVRRGHGRIGRTECIGPKTRNESTLKF